MNLDALLQASELCLQLCRAGRYEESQAHIDGYNQSLERYLRAMDITGLSMQQHALLKKINDNHQAVIEIIAGLKQQVRERVTQLRHGHQLSQLYDPG